MPCKRFLICLLERDPIQIFTSSKNILNLINGPEFVFSLKSCDSLVGIPSNTVANSLGENYQNNTSYVNMKRHSYDVNFYKNQIERRNKIL